METVEEKASRPAPNPVRLMIVTGLSGAGKSHVARAFEDMGWSVVDNLPLALVEPLVAELAGREEPARVVIVLDTRLRRFGEEFPTLYEALKRRDDLVATLCFVEAEEDILLQRYSETRRPHPLGGRPIEAIRSEREQLAEVRSVADSVIDTSEMNVHQLRALVARDYVEEGALPDMKATVMSFGFKRGIPHSADLVFDVRFLPNPHYQPTLRPLTGEDEPVASWLLEQSETENFFTRLEDFVRYLLPSYAAEHKSYLTIAIGCTGGQHRSVYLARRLSDALQERPVDGVSVRLHHRELARRNSGATA